MGPGYRAYDGPWDVVSVRAYIARLESELRKWRELAEYLRRLVAEDEERIRRLRKRL